MMCFGSLLVQLCFTSSFVVLGIRGLVLLLLRHIFDLSCPVKTSHLAGGQEPPYLNERSLGDFPFDKSDSKLLGTSPPTSF